MSLMRWDPFADVNTLIRLMPAGSAGFPRLALEGSGARKVEWATRVYALRINAPAGIEGGSPRACFADRLGSQHDRS
jgi:hypothetical protein